MLSRIAESLYWIGRYTERGEDTARLLDIAHRASLEGRGAGGWTTVDEVMRTSPSAPRRDVIVGCALDRANPESVASCVRAARENARTVREAITSEMWEALNTWHLAIAATGPGELESSGVHRFLSSMKERAFLFVGTADGTMLRDEGWHWLTTGRYVERLVFTGRVLGSQAATLRPTDSAATAEETYDWTVLLRSLSAQEAYRKTYRTAVDAQRAAGFVLLDPDFPRSSLYCARQVERSVTVVTEGRSDSLARRTAGRLRAELEFRRVSDVVAQGVRIFLGEVSADCVDLHAALAQECFARGEHPALAPVAS